jgi:hypothetical protein
MVTELCLQGRISKLKPFQAYLIMIFQMFFSHIIHDGSIVTENAQAEELTERNTCTLIMNLISWLKDNTRPLDVTKNNTCSSHVARCNTWFLTTPKRSPVPSMTPENNTSCISPETILLPALCRNNPYSLLFNQK